MLTNSACTLYHKSGYGYKRYYYSEVYWSQRRNKEASPTITKDSKNVTVFLFDNQVIPENDDILVRGKCTFDLSASSEAELSKKWKKFIDAYDYITVQGGVTDAWFGGLPHYELSGV